MKTPFLILSLCFITVVAFDHTSAQSRQAKIDSLQILLKTAAYDTKRVDIYSELSWNYASTREKTDSARIYADSVRILSEELKFEPGKIKAHFYYGVIARHEGNYDDALSHLNSYVNYHKAINNNRRVATGLFQIGVVHKNMGNYEKSLKAYQRVLAIYEQNKFWNGVGFTLNGIGIIYRSMKKYDYAIEHYSKALALYDSLDAAQDKSNVLGNLANVYAETGRYEKANIYYEQSLQINRAIGSDWGIAYNLENIGNMLNRMERHDSALVYQLDALAIRERLPQQREIALSHKQLGKTYFQLKNYSMAENHLEKGLHIANEIELKPLKRDLYLELAKLRAAEKKFKDAYTYHQKYEAAKDSILNEVTTRQINELQVKYEAAKKNEEIATLSKENEMKAAQAERRATWNKILIGGLILAAIIAGLIIYLLRQQFKNEKLMTEKNQEIKTARFKQQLSELEMRALRAQMNPHFIFNCMNSINRMILSEDSDEASRYLTKFSKLIRLMLENTENQMVSLEDELAMLETYIELESLRFKGKINYRISVDDTVNKEQTEVPSMVLQPFVENAIWHGLMHKDGDGLINISIKEEENMLRCVIEDNGIGREKALNLQESTVHKNKSMGLQITKERLELLNNRELQDLIRITDLKDSVDRALGTRVDISIPIG